MRRTVLRGPTAPARLLPVAVALAAVLSTSPAGAQSPPARGSSPDAAGPRTAPPGVLLRTGDEGPTGPLSEDLGSSGLVQQIRKLRTTGSVLYTAGHPDDEEAGVLTLLSRGMGVRTALLTLNRGEGGANAIGPELFDALGLIRTEELRLAGRYYGLDDQYFTTAVDYGYSKTLDEAFRSWDAEALLADMVRIIRVNRPLVVISRWHGSERDGHGHHQATGVLTPRAVAAAADPDRFPGQITREGLRPWRARHLYRGRVRDGEPRHVALDPGRFSPALGRTFHEFGALGLALQRSQTAGRVRRGPGLPVRYERLRGVAPGGDLFAGLDLSPSGVFGLVGEAPPAGAPERLREAERHVERADSALLARDLDGVARHLAAGLAALRGARARVPPDGDAAFLLAVEEAEFERALATALGLRVRAVAARPGDGPDATFAGAVPGAGLAIHVEAAAGAGFPVPVDLAPGVPAGFGAEGRVTGTLGAGSAPLRAELAVRVPPDAVPDRPWFSRPDLGASTYDVLDSSAVHLAEAPARVTVRGTVRVGDVPVRVEVPVRVTRSDLPWGSGLHPLRISPTLAVSADPAVALVSDEGGPVPVRVTVTSAGAGVRTATLGIDVPPGWTVDPARREVRLAGEGDASTVEFSVRAPPGPAGDPPPGGSRAIPPSPDPSASVRRPALAQAWAETGGRRYRGAPAPIRHRGLLDQVLHVPATVRMTRASVRIAPDLHAGYVMGVGDDVPAAIAELGADVTLLDAEALATGELDAFDVIVVGTRAYAVRAELVRHNARLLRWTRAGGHLVVLYQTPEYDPSTQAPVPATLPASAEEVSEEDAPVRILAPGHPMLAAPNRIGPADFDGWVEQRGSKFFAAWDASYVPLVESHDTGQAPQEGIWLTAPAGRGRFTYLALALHRQLPYGVAGAWRILANVLSAGQPEG